MGVNRGSDTGDALPLVLVERGESVVDDELVVLLTLLGTAIAGELLVGDDEPLRFQDSAVSSGTELQRGAGFVLGPAILPSAEVSGRLAELIETGLGESLRLVVIRGGHVVHDINHWKPPSQ